MKVVTNYSTTLSASITSTQSTIPVSSIQTSDATPHTLTITDLDNQVFLTLEPGTAKEEIVLCTGITAGTLPAGTFTGATRGLAFYGGTTTGVTGNKYSHQAGSTVIISNVHYVFDQLVDNFSDESIDGVKTFTSFPVKSGILTPTLDEQFATKKFVVDTATGTTNVDKILVAGTAGETLAAGNLVYFKVADGRWWLTDADTAATVNGVIIGFAQGTATAAVAVNILVGGEDVNQSGLTPGAVYYAGNTAGAISSSAGTNEKAIGQALSATRILLNPIFSNLPIATEKAALVGTSGTPSSTNKYVTDADTTGTGSVVRASLIKFGGSGADGALSITSGTTTIDLASAAVVVKNYTSISITGTGALAFSNPASTGTTIILRSQGAVTITSSATRAIDLRNLGATGGAGGTTGNRTGGIAGTYSANWLDALTTHGGQPGSSGSGAGGPGGVTASTAVSSYATSYINIVARRSLLVVPGSGGGGGNTDSLGADAGDGGRGAGAMFIECAGAYNVTGTIDLSGTAGVIGVQAGGGSGGGGAGGMFVALYNSLTADSGTYTVTGGAGGISSGNGTSGGGGGGGGGNPVGAGSAGTASGSNEGGPGGAGANGVAIRNLNNLFA